MTETIKKTVAEVAERIGVPTMLLLVILYGAFLLLRPVTAAHVAHLEAQTNVIVEMAIDIKKTRLVVEADRDERKGEMLTGLYTVIEKSHETLTADFDCLRNDIIDIIESDQ